MSLVMKGEIVRSPSDLYVQNLLSYQHVDHIGLLGDNRCYVRPKRFTSKLAQVSRLRALQDDRPTNGFLHSNSKTFELLPLRSSRTSTSGALFTPENPQTSTKQLEKKRVFTFGKGRSDGNKSMKCLLGGKGANLAEMACIGLSVPPGLTISTEACQEYQKNGKMLTLGLWEEILDGLESVEQEMGYFLGDPSMPLLLSVRSGATISMPGMMDTVLNLGLNDEVISGLVAKSGERFAYDSYRRFLDMFGNVVMGIPHSLFEEKLEGLKAAKRVELDTELKASDLKELVAEYKNVYLESKGEQFPSAKLDLPSLKLCDIPQY